MKLKLAFLNLSFAAFVIGLLLTVSMGMKHGAVAVIIAAAFAVIAFTIQIIQSIRNHTLWTSNNLLFTIALLVLAVVFVHGFSLAIDMSFLANISAFRWVFAITGLSIIVVFLIISLQSTANLPKSRTQHLLRIMLQLVAAASFLGLFGVMGFLPVSGWLLTYSLLVLAVFFLIFFIVEGVKGSGKNWLESTVLSLMSVAVMLFLGIRIFAPQLLPQGLPNAIIILGFVPFILLPVTIFFIRKVSVFLVFVVYLIVLDLYFIHTDANFNHLVTIGVNDCVGYENATVYPLNNDPGMPIEQLLAAPQQMELDAIRKEWSEKDFTPIQVNTESEKAMPNGDSIKVISHLVNGNKHYGLIRIPKGLDTKNAPILIGLMGGGTGIDVLKTNEIFQLSSGRCREVLDGYISIMPSFRGNVIRGDDFCFRSEGYEGDPWLGPTEDAVALLEVVKGMYGKNDSTTTIAYGVSRGATVALIMGGLTDQLDYIIANSTHTNFLDMEVVSRERVGRSYGSAFYTPKASPEEIRKKIIASSPYYFVENLPPFEVHQGTEDDRTTVYHANMLQTRLTEVGLSGGDRNVYIYEGKGHGYDDDEVVCESLRKYLGD